MTQPKHVGETVWIKATVTEVNADGTAKTVKVDKTPSGAAAQVCWVYGTIGTEIHLMVIEPDQSTTAVVD